MVFLTLNQLQSMKRSELQSLCKENNLKANSKTENLIIALSQHFDSINEEKEEVAIPISNINNKQKQQQQSTKKLNSTPSVEPETHQSPLNDKIREEDDSEDEMMLGAEPIKVVAKKVKNGKGKEKALVNTSGSSSSISNIASTSPATKTIIDQLLKSVGTLQAELVEVRSAQSTLSNTFNSLPPQVSPSSPSFSQSTMSNFLEEKFELFRKDFTKTFDARYQAVVDKVDEMKNSQENVGKIQVDIQEWKLSTLESIETLRNEFITKINTLQPSKQQAATLLPPTSPVKSHPRLSAVYNTVNSFNNNASPTLSDAPPIQSLNSFSSPPDSITNTSFAERSEVNISPTATGRTSSIFRSPGKLTTTSNILFQQGSMIKSNGKHPRYSTVSNESGNSADSPTVANGNRNDLTIGQGINKRVRISDISISQVEDTSTQFEDEEEEEVEEEEEQESFISEEASYISDATTKLDHRDTIVSTKSGEETTSIPLSTSDPSYFSAPSPSASIKAPTIAAPSPFKPRKSLPMQSLPFPIASPYTQPRPSSSKHSLLTSAAPFGNVSNFKGFGGTKPPPTPLAAKTLFGGEYADSRFGDLTDSRQNTPAKIWNNSGKSSGFSFKN